MLARFDLTARRDAWPDELSQGERSRLSVARALLSDAAVLVMDEPLAHVDTVQAGRYWQVVRTHLTERHTSLVFATHSPKTVLAEASRVICLGEGRLLFEGEVEELYRRPASRELAECLGEVNWLEPPDARLWFNVEREDALCLRPEQVAVVPAADGPDSIGIVALSRFKGDVAEVELEHTGTGKTRRIYHRPSGDHLKRGDKVLLKVILVLLIALFVGCEQSREPSLVMSEVHHWSMPPDGPKIPAPRSIATDPKGEVVVLDTSGRVLVFDRAGTFKRSWMMPEVQVGKPEGVCVLSDGRIAVSDTHYSRVILFDEEGKIVGRFGRQGTAPGEFIYPVGVAQDDAGNLYVSEYGSNDRVQKFTSDGKFLLAFGTFGTADDQFQRPSGMAWHDGKVYVADAVNNRIQVFSDDGKFLGRLGTAGKPVSLHMPYDIAMGRDGALYVIEYGAGRLTKLTLDGTVLGRFGTTGRGPEEFRTPWGLALDAAGTILVVDTGNRRIVELKP